MSVLGREEKEKIICSSHTCCTLCTPPIPRELVNVLGLCRGVSLGGGGEVNEGCRNVHL